MEVRVACIFIFVCLIVDEVLSESIVGKRPQKCTAPGIAMYQVHLETFWSREKFSKQYPLYRPHAQWSRAVGRTHGLDYVMWREETLASSGIVQFAETGHSADLDEDSQGYKDIFDIFSLPKIQSGVGETFTYTFLDSAHPMVSLISRIIPSPDWFVGLDSISLCDGDEWAGKTQLNMKIWDAGTDKGLMFTSPNWPEVPHQLIEEITASNPKHPASSFNYAHLEELPVIARVTFTRKLVTGTLLLQRDWSSPKGEMLPSPKLDGGPSKDLEISDKAAGSPSDNQRQGELGGTADSVDIPTPRNELVGMKVAEKSEVGDSQSEDQRVDQKHRKTKTSREERRRRRLERRKKKNSKKNRKKRVKQSKASRRNSLTERTVKDIDCQVSEWQPWSNCSKTCGYGTRTRIRTVVVQASGRGIRCPLLVQEETCGSMRGCGWNHFSSDNWGTLKK